MNDATTPAEAGTPTELIDYVRRLQDHDWTHEFSDDPSVRRWGRAELGELQRQQKLIDPDCAIWNEHCMLGFGRSP